MKLFVVSILLTCLVLVIPSKINAQENKDGEFHGSFQTDIQYYETDSTIGATAPNEKMLMNSYLNLLYTKGNFSAGGRFEGYMNTLKGYDNNINNAIGVPYRWINYKADALEVTVGNYYEQFGSGLIYRTYEDKNIGYDNAMEGVRLKYQVAKGFNIKGIWGKQRYAFKNNELGFASVINGQGIVRGIDGEIAVNDLITRLSEKKTQVLLGGSFVSKYQEDDDVFYRLPENVGAYAGRLNIARGSFNIGAEYANKINDPSADNGYIYKNGEAIIINATYSKKGLGVFLTAKRVDNMSFRSERDANLTNLNINCIPVISKNHAYSLLAMYPYASQPNGEIGFQGEVMYKFKKESLLGGKYGTNLAVNYSRINSLKTTPTDIYTGYESSYFEIGDELYYQDLNVEINKKINSKLKVILTYQNLIFNYGVIRNMFGHEDVYANIGVADISYKISQNHNVRFEVQGLFTEQDMGNWGMGMIEYSVSPNWFFTVQDQYNYGNENKDMQIHYYNFAIGYSKGSNRIQVGYGKQRSGIICVGGVCRNIPASNGLTIALTSSF